jgi:hypothetical protein
MTPAKNQSYSLNNVLGTALLLSGAFLCYLHVAAIAQQIAISFAANGAENLGLFPVAGLLAARLLQALTLNPASALSALLQFLLSFWPVTFIFLGALLLRKTIFPVRIVPFLSESASNSLAQRVCR